MRTIDQAYIGMLVWFMQQHHPRYEDNGLWDFLQREIDFARHERRAIEHGTT
jgi:hypothetical protein